MQEAARRDNNNGGRSPFDLLARTTIWRRGWLSEPRRYDYHSPTFENATVKVVNGTSLTAAEAKAEKASKVQQVVGGKEEP